MDRQFRFVNAGAAFWFHKEAAGVAHLRHIRAMAGPRWRLVRRDQIATVLTVRFSISPRILA